LEDDEPAMKKLMEAFSEDNESEVLSPI